jgi:hypothetical protein
VRELESYRIVRLPARIVDDIEEGRLAMKHGEGTLLHPGARTQNARLLVELARSTSFYDGA